MACCAIKHCKNYSTKKDTPKKTFHLFPRDTKLANQWADIVRESRNEFWWQPNTWSCICSDHFSVNDKYTTKSGHQRLKTGALPSEALVLPPESDDKQEPKRAEDQGSIVKKPTAKRKRSCAVGNRSQRDGNSGTVQLPEAKEIINSVYRYLQNEYENLKSNIGSDCDLTPLSNILKRTAEATGVSEHTVTSLLEKGKRPLESKHKTVQRKRAKSSHYSEENDVSSSEEESSSGEKSEDQHLDDHERAQSSRELDMVQEKLEEDEEHNRAAVNDQFRVDIEVTSCETESAVMNLLSTTQSGVTDDHDDMDYQQTSSAVQSLLSSEQSEIKEGFSDSEYWQSASMGYAPPDAVKDPVKTELYDDD